MRLQSTFSEYIKKCIIWLLSPSLWALVFPGVVETPTHAGAHRHASSSSAFLSLIRMVSLVFPDSQAAKHISHQAGRSGREVTWYLLILSRHFFFSKNGEAGVGHVGYKTCCVPSRVGCFMFASCTVREGVAPLISAAGPRRGWNMNDTLILKRFWGNAAAKEREII